MSAQRMFYAVARGRATGVFGSWPEAERLVSGFAGARFKKFKSQSEAAAFVRGSPAPATRASSTTKPKRTTYKPPRGTVAVYTDGGCRGNQNVDSKRDQPAGWGFIAVRDGKVLAERWGPVVIDSGHAHYLGAEKKSNNTGELSGVAEALLWLRDEEGSDGPAALCYDSTYAANITSGAFRAHKNVDLAKTCRDLYCSEGTRRKRKLALEHVKGHSGDALNERADALVQRGVAGESSGRGSAAPAPEFELPSSTIDAATAAAIEERRLAAVARRDSKKRAAASGGGAPSKKKAAA